MGIPVVVVAAGGLPITVADHGFGVPMTIADNGYGMPVTFVPSGGLAVTGIASGASIAITSMVILENAGIGTPVGTLSVLEGTGTYTYTITADPENKFAIVGNQLRVANSLNYEADQFHPVTIRASNGVDTPITRSITVSVLNVLEVTLSALTLSASTINESSVEDTVVGTLGALTSGATLSMTDTASGRFKLSGNNVVAGATPTDYETTTSHSITVRQTHPDGNNSPRDTTFVITVNNISDQPVNSVAPVISGSTEIGSVLSLISNGTWTNSPTGYTFQWKRNGTPIGGAVTTSYTLLVGDVGATIICTVTAINPGGTGTADSNAKVGTDSRPVNSVAPVISGTAIVFNTLTVTNNGTWTNSPTSYAYQWLRDGVAISGQTGANYTTDTPDIGADISCRVTASNSFGTAVTPAVSNAIEVVSDIVFLLDTPTIDLDAASDTGSSSTDNITSDTTPSFTVDFPSGLLEGDHIIVRDNGVTVSDHVVTEDEATGGEIDLGLSALTLGTHSITISQHRGASISDWSTALVLTIDTAGPTMTSATSTSVNENATLAFALTASAAATFSIVGGVDAAQFAITGSTLTWVGDGTQNYEAPLDAGANNTYVVSVAAAATLSGALGTPQTITVTVLDVTEGFVYVGPGDIAPAASWWGLRAYSLASIGDPLIHLVRISDDAEMDFGSLADGSLDVAGITTWLGASSGKILWYYDQGPNNQDFVAASPTAHPPLVLSGVDGKPQIAFNGLVNMIKPAATAIAQPFTLSMVARRTSHYSDYHGVLGGNVNGLGFGPAANYGILVAGGGVSYFGGVTDGSFNSIIAVFNGASSAAYANGAVRALEFDTDPGSGSLDSPYILSGFGGSPLYGDFREGGIWTSALSVPTQTALDANQTDFWSP